ncbi:hypothetical protein [Rhodococcus sp. T7]|uniref:hypothetical protein n=1 Tax=Rhodococcus sp. T7 TaxID=627444 RepID=UPI001358E7B1|nr:hypothetical protein [Rhodococcus sp. T7]KAF0958463.1 hypothetical protein MLGJGCBP_08442 [Rhodococcus sp. T7]
MKHHGQNPVTGTDPTPHLETPRRRQRRLRREHDDDLATILGTPGRRPALAVTPTTAELLLLAMYGPQALERTRTHMSTPEPDHEDGESK